MMFLILGIFVGIFILILVCFAIFYKQILKYIITKYPSYAITLSKYL